MATCYRRLGLTLATIATALVMTAPSFASTDRTYASTDPGYGYNIVIGYVDYDRMIDVAPLALFKEQPPAVTQRSYQTFKSMPVKTRAGGAAILATTQAGWRSGRLRHLSAG